MDGFNILTDALKTSINKAGTFKLRVVDEGLEIFESHINAGKSIICQPYECAGSISAAYVMSGKIYHTNDDRYIEPKSWFVCKNLKETHHLSVLEDSTLLMVRTANIVDEQMTMIESISEILHKIQEKDQYTEMHCNNTGNLAVQIATFMKLDEKKIENILYSGKCHDVGKVDLPVDVLNKPHSLTEQEYDLVKTHSEIGSKIIREVIKNEDIAEIIHQHHEKLDGSGYPRGLVGDEISMEARVLLVADSYDAMTTDRPYRARLSSDSAIQELLKYSGIWYDEDVVDTLVHVIKRTKI